ncbi:hypothetical protein N7465_011408 [Penicillium sp. CMV-2018d]|nr:hypothetical protein N7465_011408 [Penicillium sp. CMV-2018d]
MGTVATWMVFHFSIHNSWDNLKQEARLALSYVRLADEGVFYCLGTMTPQQRSARFQADFDQHGDICTGRIPLDPPMIIWANGLPWFPVYKAFYVLCGTILGPPIPFHTLSIDFVTGLPRSKKGFDAVAIYTCKSTTRIGSTSGKKTWKGYYWATAIIHDLQKGDWGVPVVWISHRDKMFVEGFWEALFTALHAKLLYTAAYHPSADRQSEHVDWNEGLAPMQASLNAPTNVATGDSSPPNATSSAVSLSVLGVLPTVFRCHQNWPALIRSFQSSTSNAPPSSEMTSAEPRSTFDPRFPEETDRADVDAVLDMRYRGRGRPR